MISSKLIAASAMLLILTIGCEKSEQLPLSLDNVNHSPCKSSLKTENIDAETPDTLSCVQYSYNNVSKILTIEHINTAFNCCPGTISCNVSLQSDTIILTESESSSLCDCNCLYDLEFEIKNVESAEYVLKINDSYSGKEEKIIFGLNMKEMTSGSWCATRKNYPWGINPH